MSSFLMLKNGQTFFKNLGVFTDVNEKISDNILII